MSRTPHKRNFSLKEKLYLLLLLGYSLWILWEMFLGPYRTQTKVLSYNLVPFKSIIEFITHFSLAKIREFLINIVGNILFFVPFGILLPLLFPATFATGKRMVILFALCILLLEVMQMLFRVGFFDVDDILLNTIGAFIGYLFYAHRKKTA